MELLDRATAAEYASRCRALASPSRVQLVELLARHGQPMSVGQIVTAMGLAQSTVSKHLKVLAEVQFVLVEQVHKVRYYRINNSYIAYIPGGADLVTDTPTPRPRHAGTRPPRNLTRSAK